MSVELIEGLGPEVLLYGRVVLVDGERCLELLAKDGGGPVYLRAGDNFVLHVDVTTKTLGVSDATSCTPGR